jgi:hypothetical protein
MSQPFDSELFSLKLSVTHYQENTMQPETPDDHRICLEEILNQLMAMSFFLSVVDETKLNTLPVECDLFQKYGHVMLMLTDEATHHHNAFLAHYETLKRNQTAKEKTK